MADMNRGTFADLAKMQNPDGTIAQVYELMEQYNPPMQDGVAFPSNAPFGHRTTFRRALPVVGTAQLNKGVIRSKSAIDQKTDVMGYFAGRSEIDERFIKTHGVAAFENFRRKEDRAFEEALAQLVCQTFLYGNIKTDEASFDGIQPRLETLNEGANRQSSQVWRLNSGIAPNGDGCSIYVVDWGEDAVHWIYPPNTTSGLDYTDKGSISVNDTDGNPMFAYTSLYDWMCGVSVEDPRHLARLCNIDLSDAKLAAPTQGKIIDQLEEIMSFMPAPGPNRRVMYCPLKLWSAFNKQARSAANLALSIQDYLGEPTPHFWGYPLRRVEKQSVTESNVT